MVVGVSAKSLQSCLTLCNPLDGSPTGSPIPGILQARTLEWVAISFSNAWKWKVKVKSLSCVRLLATPWMQPTRLLCPWYFQARVLEWGAVAFSEVGVSNKTIHVKVLCKLSGSMGVSYFHSCRAFFFFCWLETLIQSRRHSLIRYLQLFVLPGLLRKNFLCWISEPNSPLCQ